MTATHKASKSLMKEPSINPKTGRVWSLADPELHSKVSALKAELKDPLKAQAFLKEAGIFTPTGRLSKRFGG